MSKNRAFYWMNKNTRPSFFYHKTSRPLVTPSCNIRYMPAFCVVDPDTKVTQYWCTKCQRYQGAAAFSTSSLARRLSRCRACRSKIELERRARSPIAKMAHCLYEQERTYFGYTGPLMTHAFVQGVLTRFDGRSVLSGGTEKLRLRRFWPDLPLSDWNVVVVTAAENRDLGYGRSEADFPPDFLRRMVRLRQDSWRRTRLARKTTGSVPT